MSTTSITKDTQGLMVQAPSKSKIQEIITTDKLQACLGGIERSFFCKDLTRSGDSIR